MTYVLPESDDDTALRGEMPLTGDLSAYVAEAAKNQPGDISFNTDEAHLMHNLLLQAPVVAQHEEGAQLFCRHVERAALLVLKSAYAKSISVSIHISQSPIKPPDHIDSMAAYILFDGGAKQERQFILSPNQPPPDEKAMSARRGISVLCLPLPGDAREVGLGPDPGIFQLSLKNLHALANESDFIERDRPALELLIALMNSLAEQAFNAETLLRRAVSLLLEYSEDKDLSFGLRMHLRAIAQSILHSGNGAAAFDGLSRAAQEARLYRQGGSIGGPAVGLAPGFPGLHAGEQPQEEENSFRKPDGTVEKVVFWAPGGRAPPQPQQPPAQAYVAPVEIYETAKYPEQPHLPEQTVNTWLPNPEGGTEAYKAPVQVFETAKYPSQPEFQKPYLQTPEGYDEAIRGMWEQGFNPLEIGKWLMISPKLVDERARALGMGPPGDGKPPVQQTPRPVEAPTVRYESAAAYGSAVYASAAQAPAAHYEQATPAPVQNLAVAGALPQPASTNPVYESAAYPNAATQENAAVAAEQNLVTQSFAPTAAPGGIQAAANEVGGATPAPQPDAPGSEAPPEDTANHQAISQSDIETPRPEPEPSTQEPEPEQNNERHEPEQHEEEHPEPEQHEEEEPEPERREERQPEPERAEERQPEPERREERQPEPERAEEHQPEPERREERQPEPERHEEHQPEPERREERQPEPERRAERQPETEQPRATPQNSAEHLHELSEATERPESRGERLRNEDLAPAPDQSAGLRAHDENFAPDATRAEAFQNTPPAGGFHHLLEHALKGGEHMAAAPAFHPAAFRPAAFTAAPATGLHMPGSSHAAAFTVLPAAMPHHVGPLTVRPNGFYTVLALTRPTHTDSRAPKAAPSPTPAAAPVIKGHGKAKATVTHNLEITPQQAAYHDSLLHSFPTPDLSFSPGSKRAKIKK